MAFLNLHFPLNISKGSINTVSFSTNISESTSGREFRSQINSTSKLKYIITNCINSKEDAEKIINFFRICKGKYHSFRFQDILDNSAKNQELMQISEKKFQIMKKYSIGDQFILRKITKPIAVKIYINSMECTINKYSIDYQSGIIEFFENINENEKITADFEFDSEMRFDSDELGIEITGKTTFSSKDIVLIEVI